MTTDSGANMVKALDLNAWTRLQCFGHRLHLAIEKSAKDPRVDRTVSILKKMVSAFSFSWKKKRELARLQTEMRLPPHKLITDSPTRWGSKLAMIERVLEQEKAISEILKADKDEMESVVKALGPLRDFTDALSGEDYVSVSYVKPVLHLFKEHLLKADDDDTDLSGEMKMTILNYLTDKYKDPKTDELLDMASLVDPRFKTKYIDSDNLEKIQARAVSELESLLNVTVQAQCPAASSSTSTSQSPEAEENQGPHQKKAKKTLASFLKTSAVTAAGTSASPSLKEAIEAELKSYLSVPNVDSEMDPLEWATLKPEKVDKLIFRAKNL
ncbi:Zinc finger BED domain containing protein 1 [Dissostichus eleginoides]|uniref:Zinc finger BED domain containing protein 1 n=1 Tax=Dissostichus eleginoides TaxID=100907 RepID=A0AAD9BMJ1_DISEL|nr:Zinc finger BED domain containing protein 1 [Dissostichus eleginoides]